MTATTPRWHRNSYGSPAAMQTLVDALSTGPGVEYDLLESYGQFGVQVLAGGSTHVVVATQGSLDGTHWSTIGTSTFAGDGVASVSGPPVTHVRASLVTKSGPGAVNAWLAASDEATTINAALTVGSDVTDRATRLLGHVAVDSLPAVIANLGTIGAAATEATLAALRASFESRFHRLLSDVIPDGWEKRLDLGVNDLYMGMAPDGAATASGGLWTVMRIYLTAGSPTRTRTRTGVDWDSRTSGWT